MPLLKQGPLLLHHSLQPTLSEISPGSLCREGLSNDGRKGFGGIHSSISLGRDEKMGCMPDIGSREFWWMTSRGDRKVGEVLYSEPGDSRGMQAS